MENEKNYQEKLNSTISSDTIKILSLLKSYPSTGTSSSFHQDKKQNLNSSNENNNTNNNLENYSLEEIKAICLRVFMLYAEPINGQFYLSQRYTFQILKEMEIISEKCLSYIDIEILNQQVNKKGDKLNSEQFLDLLAKICCLLDDYFYKDKRASFLKLIQLYIIPYLQKKENNKNIEINEISNKGNNTDANYSFYESKHLNLNFKDLILNEYKLDKDSFDILTSIIEGLKLIYRTYFSLSEMDSPNKPISKIHKESFGIFIKLLKDFEIIPFLLKQRLAELYWSIIISIDISELYHIDKDYENNDIFKSFLSNKKNNLGKVYTFKKFFLLFSHISFNYYYCIKSKTNGQKLLYLIEKIYRSKAYEHLPNIYNKTFSRKFSIIPPVNIVKRINKNIIDEKMYNNNNKMKKKVNYRNILELNESNNSMLQGYLEHLKIIFDLYSHSYNRSIYGKMSFTSLQKMLYDGGILLNTNVNVGKENNLNSTNQKLNKSNSEEIIKINHESPQNDLIQDNNRYNNISENSNVIINSNISLEDKKINSNFESTQSINNKAKQDKNKKDNKRKLKLIDLNIIISKICHNPNLDYPPNKEENSTINAKISYQIDFILFLKTLSLIALKIYPNEKNDINISMEQFLKKGMDEFLSNLNQKTVGRTQNDEINKLLEFITNNDTIIQLMNDISTLIKSYFDFYTVLDENKIQICDFHSFLRFFKDYEIYPIWINLSNLYDIFYVQIYRMRKENENFFKIFDKINFPQFLECFVAVGIMMNSGNDFDMIDKVLFMLDKMFSESYGKITKRLKTLPSFKEDFFYYEKILREKYPSYYERKYSNCNHRYDNKFYWAFEKNYADNNPQTQQIDFGELFNKEKVKFNDMFEELSLY